MKYVEILVTEGKERKKGRQTILFTPQDSVEQ